MGNLKELESKIDKLELQADNLKKSLRLTKMELDSLYDERRQVILNNCEINAGTELLFKDIYNNVLKIVVVENSERFNAVLLTDYSYEYEHMIPYYLFDFNCIFGETLINSIENEYALKFIKVL